MRAATGILLLAAATRVAAACDPSGTLHIVVANDSPGVAPDSHEAQPVAMYRAGDRRVRVEEPEDAARHAFPLRVTSVPDTWLVNRLDGTGTHTLDPDRAARANLPVFRAGAMPVDFPATFRELEYGCEAEFFRRNDATQAKDGGVVRQQLASGAWRLVLVADGRSTPQSLQLVRDGRTILSLRYEAFERIPRPDPALFAKPAGVWFRER